LIYILCGKKFVIKKVTKFDRRNGAEGFWMALGSSLGKNKARTCSKWRCGWWGNRTKVAFLIAAGGIV
jgi:hypothetical protein